MANPLYHSDPEFYERPGETVHLEVDQHPSMFTVPALPWQPRETRPGRDGHASALGLIPPLIPENVDACVVCGRAAVPYQRDRNDPRWYESVLCAFCARAQGRDETFKARANIPQPSRPRIAIREGWEVFAGEQSVPVDDSLESGHVRPYETRIG